MTLDLLQRIRIFYEAIGPAVLVPAGIVLIVLLLLTVMGKRNALIGLYLFCLMFSGFAIEAVALGSALLRWLIMFLIALTCIYGVRSPGLPALMLGGYAILGLVTVPMAPSLSWAIQRAGLAFIATIPMVAAISHQTATMDDIKKLLKLYLIAAGLYVLLGMISLPSLVVGLRFVGAGRAAAAALFAVTGGLLLPIALWGAMYGANKRWRSYCIFIMVSIGLLLVISGQRTGTFAGLIGCLPILARFGIRKLFLGIVLVGLGMMVIVTILSFMPEQSQFVQERFFSIETTGRLERWSVALSACLEEPFWGHGRGGHLTLGFGFHNAYLAAWYDGGLIGLILFSGAFVVMIFQAFRLVVQRVNREVSDLARLLLGLSLASTAAAFFELKLYSPSNVAVLVVLVTSVMLTRMNILVQQSWYELQFEQEWPSEYYLSSEY